MKYGEMKMRYHGGSLVTPNMGIHCDDDFFYYLGFSHQEYEDCDIIVEAHDCPYKGRAEIQLRGRLAVKFYKTKIGIMITDKSGGYFVHFLYLVDLHHMGINYKENTYFWVSIKKLKK